MKYAQLVAGKPAEAQYREVINKFPVLQLGFQFP